MFWLSLVGDYVTIFICCLTTSMSYVECLACCINGWSSHAALVTRAQLTVPLRRLKSNAVRLQLMKTRWWNYVTSRSSPLLRLLVPPMPKQKLYFCFKFLDHISNYISALLTSNNVRLTASSVSWIERWLLKVSRNGLSVPFVWGRIISLPAASMFTAFRTCCHCGWYWPLTVRRVVVEAMRRTSCGIWHGSWSSCRYRIKRHVRFCEINLNGLVYQILMQRKA